MKICIICFREKATFILRAIHFYNVSLHGLGEILFHSMKPILNLFVTVSFKLIQFPL